MLWDWRDKCVKHTSLGVWGLPFLRSACSEIESAAKYHNYNGLLSLSTHPNPVGRMCNRELEYSYKHDIQ